jgi:hypothetical protein
MKAQDEDEDEDEVIKRRIRTNLVVLILWNVDLIVNPYLQ